MFYDGKEDSFMTKNKTFYVIILCFCLLPVFIQKHLKELTIISIILFFGVACFVIIISAQLIVRGNFANPDEDQSYQYMDVEANFDLIKGISMIFVAYLFQ